MLPPGHHQLGTSRAQREAERFPRLAAAPRPAPDTRAGRAGIARSAPTVMARRSWFGYIAPAFGSRPAVVRCDTGNAAAYRGVHCGYAVPPHRPPTHPATRSIVRHPRREERPNVRQVEEPRQGTRRPSRRRGANHRSRNRHLLRPVLGPHRPHGFALDRVPRRDERPAETRQVGEGSRADFRRGVRRRRTRHRPRRGRPHRTATRRLHARSHRR